MHVTYKTTRVFPFFLAQGKGQGSMEHGAKLENLVFLATDTGTRGNGDKGTKVAQGMEHGMLSYSFFRINLAGVSDSFSGGDVVEEKLSDRHSGFIKIDYANA